MAVSYPPQSEIDIDYEQRETIYVFTRGRLAKNGDMTLMDYRVYTNYNGRFYEEMFGNKKFPIDRE